MRAWWRRRPNYVLPPGPHRATAYGCVLWRGDNGPVDWGVCPTCGPHPYADDDDETYPGAAA